MSRRTLVVIAFLLGGALGAPGVEGQQRTVTGRVLSAGTREPLSSASIRVLGTDATATADNQGSFRITVPTGTARLRVGNFGYLTQEVVVPAGESSVTIRLEQDFFDLEGIVVTGQATSVARRNLANSVGSVTAEQITDAPPAESVEKILQGKVAGALIETNSGAPGGGVQVRLRGVSTINGDLEPLYVIDGVVMSNASISNNANVLTASNGPSEDAVVNRAVDLNPDDIASVEILKGASAAALYGSRAANGVVIIQTKRGTPGDTRVRLSQTFGTYRLSNKFEFRDWNRADAVDFFGFGETTADLFFNADGSPRVNLDYEELVAGRTDLSWSTDASVSGGDERTRYFVSGSWQDDAGIIEKTGFTKQSFRLNLDHDFTDRIRLSAGTSVLRTEANRGLTNNDNNGISYYMVLPFTTNFIDLRKQGDVWPDHPFERSNPLETIATVDDSEEVYRFTGSANLEVDLLRDDRSALRSISTVGADWFNQENTIFSRPGSQFEPSDGFDGTSLLSNSNNLDLTATSNLVYELMGEGFSSNTTVGLQFEKRDLDISRIVAQGLNAGQPNTDAAVSQVTQQTRNEINDLGFFAQEELLLADDRLLLSAGVRADRSSVNGETDRYFWYPKAAASYRWDDMGSLLSALKLRAAFGQSGNQPLYGQKFTSLNAQNNVRGIPGVFVAGLAGSADLEPERQSEIEAGADLTLFDGRAQLEATVYRKSVSDLILSRTPSLASGFQTQLFNGGELEVDGIELGLSATPVVGEGFSWTSQITFSHDESTITELPVPAFETGGFGTSLGAFRIEEGASTTQIVINSGIDEEGDLIVAKAGDVTPDFRLAFGNDITLGPVRISGLFDWSHGASVLNLTRFLADLFGNSADFQANVRERELPGGGTAELGDGEARLAFQGLGDSRGYLEGSSYLKLREVSVGYTLPDRFVSGIFGQGAEQIRLRATGRNLYTWTGYTGLDPEVSNFGNQAVARNIDVAPFPASRSFWLSVDFLF